MEYTTHKITSLSFITHDTFILQVNNSEFSLIYSSGEYCYIKNPRALTPEEERPFSIASSPLNTSYIEFCIKIYGEWTRQLSQLTPGTEILVSSPQKDIALVDVDYLIFLVGGVGIAPVMSMVRCLIDRGSKKDIVILYGNKTEKDIIYREELKAISLAHPHIHIVHVLSEEPEHSNWKGERGFLTHELLSREVDLNRNPYFYMYGNPMFLKIAKKLVDEIKKETLQEPPRS